MPRFSRRHNPSHKQYTLVSLDDLKGALDWLDPLVESKLYTIASMVADEAEKSDAFNDSEKNVDVKRNLDFWPDYWYPHKHLRKSFQIRKSRYAPSSFIVRAARPYSHLVEYGHYKVTHSGRTIGFVPPHAFLEPALKLVLSRLGRDSV